MRHCLYIAIGSNEINGKDQVIPLMMLIVPVIYAIEMAL